MKIATVDIGATHKYYYHYQWFSLSLSLSSSSSSPLLLLFLGVIFKINVFFYSLTGKLIKKKKKKNHSNTYFKLGYFICHLRYTISGRKPILSCRKPITRLGRFIGSQRTVPSKEVVLIIQYSLKLTQTNFAELPFPHPLIIVLRNVLATLA